jgi:hypothetical protein
MQRRNFVKSLMGTALLFPSALRAFQTTPDPSIKRVLVMFKCHFDAGFIDTQTAVVHRYFKQFFPGAIDIAAQLRHANHERYVWTTGSWLLYEYLEQASPVERTRMEQAIARGDIAWHALPFTWQTEMLDKSMISGSIGISQALDRRFGQTTTGAKMTDVPGHTRGLVAPLVEQGVTFLDIGVNDASRPAQVPPMFRWKSPSGPSLVVMYHHSYGGVAQVPGSDLAIATVVKDDDLGPHTIEEISSTYATLLARFPNAQITPTSLTAIANAVAPYRDALPELTGEIGDTWIHGVASDPLKVARYREVCRLRSTWLAQGKFSSGDATDVALLRHLLLEVEHTWGTDTKTWLDFDHYIPSDLAPMLATKNYKVVQYSWQEKRRDLFTGIATLPEPLREQSQAAVRNLVAVPPKLAAPNVNASAANLDTPHFVIGIDPGTGAIHRLFAKKTGREWASEEHPLALFSYQTLSQKDYSAFFNSYVISTEDWAYKDFGKPNIQRFGAESREWLPTLTALQVEKVPQGHRLLAHLAIADQKSEQSGQASFPKTIYMELLLPDDEPVIHLNLFWFQKPATRMPEALWLSFHPITSDPNGWTLEKSGEKVSPFEVVPSGNRHMHALSKGFSYQDAKGEFAVETLDAPVVTLGVKSPFPFSNTQPDPQAGIHCNLFNNAWGTNYIMWFGGDMRFRFVLRA